MSIAKGIKFYVYTLNKSTLLNILLQLKKPLNIFKFIIILFLQYAKNNIVFKKTIDSSPLMTNCADSSN